MKNEDISEEAIGFFCRLTHDSEANKILNVAPKLEFNHKATFLVNAPQNGLVF